MKKELEEKTKLITKRDLFKQLGNAIIKHRHHIVAIACLTGATFSFGSTLIKINQPYYKELEEKHDAYLEVMQDYENILKDEPEVAKREIDKVLVEYFNVTPPETLAESIIMLRDEATKLEGPLDKVFLTGLFTSLPLAMILGGALAKILPTAGLYGVYNDECYREAKKATADLKKMYEEYKKQEEEELQRQQEEEEMGLEM